MSIDEPTLIGERKTMTHNVCSNTAVVFAAQNDAPVAARNDSFSRGEGRIPRRGKNNGTNTTDS